MKPVDQSVSTSSMPSFRRGLAVAVAAASLLGLGLVAPAQAGTLVVAGDTDMATLVNGLAVDIDAGNQAFFSDLLGSGKSVAIDYGVGRGEGYVAPGHLQQYYGGLGASVALYHDNLTAADLQGVQLLVTSLPDDVYSSAQIAAISALLARGGNVLFMGENNFNFSLQDLELNADLAALGSSLSLGVDSLNNDGYTQVGAGQIGVSPLTQGVGSFTYAWTDSVTGGTALVSTLEGTPFIESQTFAAAVPEPTSFALMLAGLGAFAAFRRRPRA